MRQLHRGQLKALFADKLRAGLARKTVQLIHATLRAMLNAAVDDGVILANPATRLGHQLRLVTSPRARQDEIKAMTREQLRSFLAAATAHTPRYTPLFLLLARTGMRLGEALAFQWQDVNFSGREMRVARTFSAGRLETPKSGHGRTLDMSEELATALKPLAVERKREALRQGWQELPPWVFVAPDGAPLNARTVEGAFKRALKAGGLPGHFTPHGLRHSYASLLLQAGKSPLYVQQQLGHASIRLTVDLYGRWLPLGDKGAVNCLDEGIGSRGVFT